MNLWDEFEEEEDENLNVKNTKSNRKKFPLSTSCYKNRIFRDEKKNHASDRLSNN